MQQGRMGNMTDVEVEVGNESFRSGESFKHSNLNDIEENTALAMTQITLRCASV